MNGKNPRHQERNPPAITVIMSVFNGVPYLTEAVDSILGQTFRDFEFIIIDDGSVDGTREILRSYRDSRIRLVFNENNMGLTRSLNKGLSLSRGEFIARLDADDISCPDRLEKQFRFMRDNPDVAVLGTQAYYIDGHGRPIRYFAPGHPCSAPAARYSLMFVTPVSHTTVMYRRDIVHDCFGGYDPAYEVGQDADLWCRLGKDYSIRNLPEALVAVRIRPMTVSYDFTHPRRVNHYNQWVKRFPEVMREILENDGIPGEWGKWWMQVYCLHGFIGKDESTQLMLGLDHIQDLFFNRYPEARGDREILKVTAGLKAQVALHLVARHRLASVKAFRKAAKTDRGIALLYAPKYLSLLLFGQIAHKLYKILIR